MSGSGGSFTIAIDIGGTLTDCVVLDESGRVTAAKSFSTPDDPTRGVLDVLLLAAQQRGLSLAEFLQDARFFIHGTTITTNALLEGKGARVGLLTTRGHEDVIPIGRVNQKVAGLSERQVTRGAFLDKPDPPIIDPLLIRGVSERMDSDGEVVVPINWQEVEEALDELLRAKIEALAVCFLWSFLNPEHERAVREFVHRRAPGLYVTLSSELAPVMGEYERAVTAVLSAYLGPSISKYLGGLEDALKRDGYEGPVLLLQAGGGLTTPGDACDRPLATLDSGPVGGILGAKFFADHYGERNVLCTDVGGTSFDVGLIRDGEILLQRAPVARQYTYLSPKVDIRTVGAGGGSVAWVDPLGILHVGPQSAGAVPGPACYDRGGESATVTDANLILGHLNPDYFLGGRKKLNVEKARQVLHNLGAKVKMDEVRVARGILTILDAQMSDLIRRSTIEQGVDPRNFVLFAYGGAGPLHAAVYGRALGVKGVYVLRYSAVFSAFGMLTASHVHFAEISIPGPLPWTEREFSRIKEALGSLGADLRRRFDQEGVDWTQVELKGSVTVRYRMQVHEVEVPMELKNLALSRGEDLVSDFERRYRILYGEESGYREAGIEMVGLRLVGSHETVRPNLIPVEESGKGRREAPMKGRRSMYFEAAGEFVDAPVFDGEKFDVGHRVNGPCAVERVSDTVLIPPGAAAEVDRFLNLKIKFV